MEKNYMPESIFGDKSKQPNIMEIGKTFKKSAMQKEGRPLMPAAIFSLNYREVL